MSIFSKVSDSIAEIAVEGGLFAGRLSRKMDRAEDRAMSAFHSFVDKKVIDKANVRARNFESASAGASKLGQSKAVFGDMLNKAAGGAIIGGVGNAAIYSDQQRDLGGSYSMGEAFLSGAAAGAFGGAVVGALGAKATARGARGNLKKAEARLAKSREIMTSRGLMPHGSPNQKSGGPMSAASSTQGSGFTNRSNNMQIGGTSRQGPIGGPGGGNGPGGGPGGLMVSTRTPKITPGGGGASASIPLIGHAQSNMSTFKIPSGTKIPSTSTNNNKGKGKGGGKGRRKK